MQLLNKKKPRHFKTLSDYLENSTPLDGVGREKWNQYRRMTCRYAEVPDYFNQTIDSPLVIEDKGSPCEGRWEFVLKEEEDGDKLLFGFTELAYSVKKDDPASWIASHSSKKGDKVRVVVSPYRIKSAFNKTNLENDLTELMRAVSSYHRINQYEAKLPDVPIIENERDLFESNVKKYGRIPVAEIYSLRLCSL